MLIVLLAVTALAIAAATAHPLQSLAKRQQGGGTPSAPPSPFPPDVSQLTVWQALEANPDFGNLTAVALNHSLAIVQLLNASAPGDNITVFAPYDRAFAPLVSEPLFQLANSSNQWDDLITRLLTYHAVNASDTPTGRGLISTDLPPVGTNVSVPTLAGLNVTIQRAAERPVAPIGLAPGQGGLVGPQQQTTPGTEAVYANDAQVVLADVVVANGVIHVVDRVLSPLFEIGQEPVLPVTSTTTSSSTTTTETSTTTTETSTTTTTPAATTTEPSNGDGGTTTRVALPTIIVTRPTVEPSPSP